MRKSRDRRGGNSDRKGRDFEIVKEELEKEEGEGETEDEKLDIERKG